jgi:hypothetical protein
MSGADRAEMQRLLASELERRGWEYDLTTVPGILDEVERTGTVDPTHLAGRVSGEYLNRVGASRADVADAIAQAIGGRTLTRPPSPPPAITIDNRNSINFGDGAQISGTNINVNSGSQISLRGDSPKEEVLDAIATLVTAGLGGEWSTDEADELDRVVASRQDILAKDVEDTTLLAAEQAGASGFSAKALAQQVVGGTASGVLASAVVAGLTSLH